ncbi:group II intron maturase-specific domain-containing protein [Micromonospora sp. NBC_01813]|uniref:group II intron maturase-specific domain-containing protein n=1 Tax=Micromonospora sp. NBC_01813 TaxID=2975988 RepID=UPI002DDC2565|nr:group II intron maturase-specific domain-containing protein [Micromonospora sp. NBC_01813]WSA10761.1 reverse transcriptase domain-containing protein [Micromonospora sp. NBC_01813]
MPRDVLSPPLSNVALSVLDEHFAQIPGGPSSSRVERAKRRRHGKANYRLVRYADDFLVLVSGTREHAEQIRGDVAEVLAPMGLRLSEEKTLITHIDEGLVFLGWHIQRHRKRGTNRSYIYTYPSRKAVKAAMDKVRTWCRELDTNQPLDALLLQLSRQLRGWCAYFRPGVSHAAFHYLSHYTWARVIGWLRRKHPKTSWKDLRRRYCDGRWWPHGQERELFRVRRAAWRNGLVATPIPRSRPTQPPRRARPRLARRVRSASRDGPAGHRTPENQLRNRLSIKPGA